MRPHVLLIDDEEHFRGSIDGAFGLRGISLDVAEDWESGLALFQVCAHELVIADYNLPPSPKNGVMLLAEAKAHRPASQLVLISGVLSTAAADILGQVALIDAYFPKGPDVADRLLEMARDAVERANAPTDWAQSAQAYLEKVRMDPADVERMDHALRAGMRG